MIDQSVNILITTHSNPDGDAIGSSVALGLLFEKLGKKVNILTPDEYPQYLKWTKGDRLITIFKKNENICRSMAREADLIFAVDYNDPGRLKNAGEILTSNSIPKILIDHHPDPKDFADLVISDTSLGSSAELIYYLVIQMGMNRYLDRHIAEALFTGIMTDTGCFSYSCSYPEVYEVVAGLMRLGIDKDEIYSRIYDNFSENRLKLMGFCLHEKMTILKPYNTAIICLNRNELEKFSHETGDTEGFVNLPFSIKGIKFTALFIEKEDHVKISFRSRGNFSVNDFSARYFRGGGHMNAAGGEWDLPIEDAVDRFIELLKSNKELNP
jgi:phosphoesterase RecJ-like protein